MSQTYAEVISHQDLYYPEFYDDNTRGKFLREDDPRSDSDSMSSLELVDSIETY